ncbi:MAG: hypothetical protein IKA02_01535 [Clostridia bacterium]|nr:hypothetical protein [Clostridia bacterium]
MVIRRIFLLFSLILVLLVFSSCERATDTNNNKNTDDLIDDLNSDTQIGDSNSDNIDNSNIGSGLQTDEDKIDVETDTNTENNDTYGNFTTLHKTIASYDRMKQMNYSKLVYNTGSKYTPDELRSTRLRANIIASAKLFFPNASDFMEHYLEGDGENYELDVEEFFENETAKKNMYNDVNSALRAVEVMYDGEKLTVYQIEESLHHNLTGDWKYSVGSYFASVELHNVKETSVFGYTCYTATLKYVVQDFYNWDSNDTNDISITSVSPADLHQLHVNGEAQEFLTYGEIEFEIRWAKGVDASTLKYEEIDD